MSVTGLDVFDRTVHKTNTATKAQLPRGPAGWNRRALAASASTIHVRALLVNQPLC